MADVPPEVNYGRVIGRFVAFIADTLDPEAIPDEVPLSGKVTLTPLTRLIRFPTTDPPRTAVAQTVVCPVIDGDLYPPDGGDAGVLGVTVVATDQPAGVPSLVQWQASFALSPTNVQPATAVFNVPTNGTVDLSIVIPVPPEPPAIIVVDPNSALEVAQAAEDAQAAADAAEAAADAAASAALDTVKVVPQTFTTTQQTQARTNVASVGRGDLVINVKDYGAVGNGTTDDTAAIESARLALVAVGGGEMLFEHGKTYLVSKITVSSKIVYSGNSATVKASAGTTEGVFQAEGWGPDTPTVFDSVIRNFTIDANQLARRGVFLYRADRCRVLDNRLSNFAVTADGGIRLHQYTNDCIVRGNHITLPIDSPFGTVAACSGINCVSNAPDTQGGGQNDTLTFGVATNLSRGHIVEGNHVYNGTHGVSLFAAQDCRIIGNHLEGSSHRGVIMSPIALRNVVSNNVIPKYGSTAVHLAWGSCFNVITNNVCVTTASIVEKNGIKGYYGCSDNLVSANHVEGPGAGAIRFAMGSARNLIIGNRVKSALIGVQIQSYLTGAGLYQPATPPAADGSTVIGNMITDTPTGISLEAFGNAGLTSTSLSSNDLKDPSTVGVLISEANGQLVSGVNAIGQRITGSGTRWTLPRGEQHFAHRVSNTALIAPPTRGYLRSGCYYMTTRATGQPTTINTLGNGVIRVTPFYVGREITLTRIGVEVTVIGDPGSALRFAIYADDGAGLPGNLVLDAGTVAGDTTGVKELTISQVLPPGTYWIGAVVQGVATTQPTVRGYTIASGVDANTIVALTSGATPGAGQLISFGYSKSPATGALPTTWGTSVAPTSSVAAVFVKIG